MTTSRRRRLRPGVTAGYVVARAPLAAAACAVGLLGVLVALPWQSCVAVLLVVGLGVALAVGACTLFGVLGWLLALLVHLLSPRSWAGTFRLRERALSSGTAVTPHEEPWASGVAAPDTPSIVVSDQLTEADLCLAWGSSFRALGKAASVAAYLTVAEARQACLDELERRDPEAFSRWLESGARASSDPSKFVTPRAVEDPRPDGSDHRDRL